MRPSDDDETQGFASSATDLAADEISRKRAQYENEGLRDPPAMRWLKFLAILVVLPVGLGIGLAIEEYFRSSDEDNGNWLLVRFAIGAAIGLAIAVAYVARCVAKDEDP